MIPRRSGAMDGRSVWKGLWVAGAGTRMPSGPMQDIPPIHVCQWRTPCGGGGGFWMGFTSGRLYKYDLFQ